VWNLKLVNVDDISKNKLNLSFPRLLQPTIYIRTTLDITLSQVAATCLGKGARHPSTNETRWCTNVNSFPFWFGPPRGALGLYDYI
jgi:hypothetical protein